MTAWRRTGLGVIALVMAASMAACGRKGDSDPLASAKESLLRHDHRAATVRLRSYLQSHPDSAQGRFLLANALLEAGDLPGAQDAAQRAEQLGHPRTQTAPLLAKLLLASHQYAALTQQYAAVELAEPAAAAALQLLVATAFTAQGEPAQAQAALNKVLSQVPDSAPALMLQARLQASRGRPDLARAQLEALLQRDQGNADAWQFKAELLSSGQQDMDGAIAAYQRAVALRPTEPQLHSALISLHFVQRDLAGAERQFQQMKTALPKHPMTAYCAAQLAFARGDAQGADALLQEPLRAAPDHLGLLHVAGAIALQLGRVSQAEAHLKKALVLQPSFVAPRRLLAKLHLRARQPAKALAVLQPALDTPGGADAETLVLAGEASLLGDDPKAAQRYFAQAKARPEVAVKTRVVLLKLAPGSASSSSATAAELQGMAASDSGVSADLSLVSLHLQRQDFDAAFQAIAALERKQPASPVAAELRGRVQLMRQDAAAARRSFEQALARDARHFPAVASLAALDWRDGRADAAADRFKAFLKREPRHVQALLALAELKKRSGGDAAQVARLIAAAVAAEPGDVQPRLVLVEHHLSTGDTKAAIAAAQAGLVALPGDADLQDRLGHALLASGELQQAGSTFARLAANLPSSALGPMGLAETSLAQKDYDAAVKHAQRALALTPGSMPAQRALISAHLGLKHPDEAVAVARAMQAQRPQDAQALLLEGDINASTGRWQAAAVAFRKALALPNPAQAPARLHFALVRAGDGDQAAALASSWLRDHPQDALFVLYLADAANKAGDLALAEQRYRQVLQIQPDNAVALNNCAVILTRQKRPGAVALAERAVKAAAGRPELLDTLAGALSSENQHAKAIALQSRVVAQAPDAPAFRLTLARLYLQAGKTALARAELDRLLGDSRPFPGRDEAQQLASGIKQS